MYDIPILLIIFKRLDTTKQVFSKIRQIQPKQLFIAADAPRQNNHDEQIKCEEVRTWILKSIDWDCEVKTLFREKNLGCGRGVSTAIDWFFQSVKSGIILEDDCMPSLSFFNYVEVLLHKYQNDLHVWQISGHNTMGIRNKYNTNEMSYSFTAIEACWGWATWKDRWQNFKYDIENENKDNLLQIPYFKKKYRRDYWFPIFNNMSSQILDIWDYQWTYRILVNHGYCAIPNYNLIENIGFGEDSTHFTQTNKDHNFHVKSFEFNNIIHPKKIKYDWKLIKFTDKKVFGIPEEKNYFNEIIKILKILLKKLHLFNILKRIYKKIRR